MSHEHLSEQEALAYATAAELPKNRPNELRETFKSAQLEVARILMELGRLKEMTNALNAEIQPWIDRMDAIEDEKEQDEFIHSRVPESVRQAIDFLNALEATVNDLSQAKRHFDEISRAAEKMYDEALAHKASRKAG
ncbi:hypothetical protein HY631_04035 [Candidatus Uhrbacteria bacterium]|nr:hypothetical protein [Candidatus Uhrbacteria bacterium]